MDKNLLREQYEETLRENADLRQQLAERDATIRRQSETCLIDTKQIAEQNATIADQTATIEWLLELLRDEHEHDRHCHINSCHDSPLDCPACEAIADSCGDVGKKGG